MRILMTTDTIGGVWTFTKDLSAQLLERGCAMALVSFGRTPSAVQRNWAEEQTEQWGECFRFVASDIPLEWMQDNERAFDEGEPLLRRVADEFGADLLLSSQFCFGALRCDFPRVVVAHSDVLSWARACRPMGLAPSAWLDCYCALVSKGLGGADGVVAPSEWMLDAVSAHFSLPPETAVIPNGRALPRTRERARRKLQAVTAGRLWDEGKNLRMLADVRPAMPLLVAGELQYESSELSVCLGRATPLGRLEEAELLSLFRASSIYICTSRYEPFGLAPLEAALCGCAVAAADIPSLREVWGEAALYFDDARSLTSLLRTLREDRALLARTRARSRNRAQKFSARRMSARYLGLFQRLLARAAATEYGA
jgi:glycosyltransferase involved in cell wall biosynthesis